MDAAFRTWPFTLRPHATTPGAATGLEQYIFSRPVHAFAITITVTFALPGGRRPSDELQQQIPDHLVICR